MSQNLYFCFHSLLLLIGGMGYTLSLDRFCICHFSCAMGRRRRFLILFAAALLLPLINAITISGILPSLCGNLVSLLWPSILALWVILLYQGQITAKISAAAILLTLTTLLHPFIGSLFSCIELLCLHARFPAAYPLYAVCPDAWTVFLHATLPDGILYCPPLCSASLFCGIY